MSKSDLLGTGAAFASARRPGGRSERGRAKAIAQGDLPDYELIRLQLDRVSPTPHNPRRNFGTDEEKTRFGEELRDAQLSACAVVSRSLYLKLWPEHEVHIGDADYVLINGERRYRSARHVALEALDFVVRDDLAASREEFIDHLLAENLDREDFDVIERARGVQQLVAICAEDKEHGAKSRAAERLGKSPGWVTQQLALLQLPEEIQQLLSAGELPERDARLLVRALKDEPQSTPTELLALLEQTKAQDAEKRAQHREILEVHEAAKAAEPSARPFTAVKTSATTAPADVVSDSAEKPAPAPVPEQRFGTEPTAEPGVASSAEDASAEAVEQGPSTSTVADPSTASGEQADASVTTVTDLAPGQSGWIDGRQRVTRMPWHDGREVAELVIEKMNKEQRTVLLECLLAVHDA
ncbi:ParB/RepB/Spo0J family partition protein [Streptomyces sp. NPDC089799]|uniref:ParB/RepB/Spo0J family partition protein n=1 Tax=Streptomyces sp. NPDC089799 TaxID=3155066 RepID=UPI0034216E19